MCSSKAPGKHPVALGILQKSSPLPGLLGWGLFSRVITPRCGRSGGSVSYGVLRGLSGSSAPDIGAPLSLETAEKV